MSIAVALLFLSQLMVVGRLSFVVGRCLKVEFWGPESSTSTGRWGSC